MAGLFGAGARVALPRHRAAFSRYFKQSLTVRTNFREKLRIALRSCHEPKNYRNPRTRRRHTGPHRAPPENARGRIIGHTLPNQWQLAGIEPGLDDSRVVGLRSLRG